MLRPQIQLQLGRGPRPGKDVEVACNHPSVEEIATIVHNGVMDVAHLVAVAYVGKKAVDTLAQIAVVAAKAKLK